MLGHSTGGRAHPARLLPVLLAIIAAMLAVVLGRGGSAAEASFPGGVGTIICSGALGTEIADPVPAGQSRLELFSVNPNGTGQTRLTTNPNSDSSPRYSADGTKVAFVRDNQIWTMNSDGTNQQGPLTSAGTQTFVGDWSPDGQQILFQSNRDGNLEVYKMNADGTNQVNLTNNPNSESEPAFSPDGKRIAFHSNRLGNSNIHVMNADGTAVAALTGDSPAEESAPRWSPDGSQIAFQSDRGFSPRPNTARNLEIYRMSVGAPSGHDPQLVIRLTFNDYDATAGSSTSNVTGHDLGPAWSPDGSRIVFHSGRAAEFRNSGSPGSIGQWEVYTVDAVSGEGSGGAGLTRITNRAGDDELCDWQALRQFTLTVAKAGAGAGTVTSAPAGISCGADCAELVNTGTQLTLTATPAEGSVFTGFSGAGCSGGATTCTVTVTEARTVTATFAQAPPPTPTPTAIPEPTPSATATPYPVARERPGLSAAVRPERDRRKPFRFTTRGALELPGGVSRSDGCRGKVGIRVKRKGSPKTLSFRLATVGSNCRFTRTVSFQNAKRFGTGKARRRGALRFAIRFQGNARLTPRTINRTARYGP